MDFLFAKDTLPPRKHSQKDDRIAILPYDTCLDSNLDLQRLCTLSALKLSHISDSLILTSPLTDIARTLPLNAVHEFAAQLVTLPKQTHSDARPSQSIDASSPRI